MQFLIDIGLSILYFCIFLLLCVWTWRFWILYINQKFLSKLDWVLLEIKLPREIMKSPLATEVTLSALLQGGGVGNPYAKFFKGALPAYSSLEIASLEGTLHFYVRVQTKFRPLIEANFYAQYPGIEIVEADDYTKRIRYEHLSKDIYTFGASYKTAKSWTPTDPVTGTPYKKDGKDYQMKANFIPIKTYVDFGLDKDPKEEFKTDPITPLLEFMGAIGKGEYFWYQVLVQDESVYNDEKMKKFFVNEVTHEHVSLKDMADARKKQIRTATWNIKDAVVVNEFGIPQIIDSFDKDFKQIFKEEIDKDGKVTKTPLKVPAKHLETRAVGKKEMELTQDEKDELEAINKKLSKPLALCVVRLIYVAKKENAQKIVEHIQNILTVQKHWNGMNTFSFSVTDPYDYPWQNIGKRRSAWRAEEKFEEYVEREGFFPHIKKRESFDKWEDAFFWSSTMKSRRLFRMIFESVFFPFDHPQASDAFVLNLEEVATLWHLPGAVAATPALPRIDSTKGMPPTNLPI